jgi:hypothetical protein
LRGSCLLRRVLEGKVKERIEAMGRRGRRRKQPLDLLKKNKRHWKLKEEAVDAHFGELGLDGAMDLS